MKIRLHNFAPIFTYSIQLTAKIKNWIRAEIWHIWRCFILFRIYAQNTGHSGWKETYKHTFTIEIRLRMLCALISFLSYIFAHRISSVRLFSIILTRPTLEEAIQNWMWRMISANERERETSMFSISLLFDILDRMQRGQNQQTNTRI